MFVSMEQLNRLEHLMELAVNEQTSTLGVWTTPQKTSQFFARIHSEHLIFREVLLGGF